MAACALGSGLFIFTFHSRRALIFFPELLMSTANCQLNCWPTDNMSIRSVLEDNKIRLFIFFAVILALSLTIYRNCLLDLVGCVLRRQGSSHGIIIPFISAFFLWQKREKLKRLKPAFALLPGVLLIVIGFIMLYATGGSEEIAVPALSFFIVLAGVIVTLFGSTLFKEVSFPFFFLITMVPLPLSLYHQIAEWMRSISTAGSTWLTLLCGVPLVRDGYYIQLPNINLMISEGCSGIRYLISYVVFGLAYAYYFKKTTKSRLMVIIATIPISILGGVIRLTIIFLAAYYIGPFMAGVREHIILSWFVFAGILVGAILLDRKVSDATP